MAPAVPPSDPGATPTTARALAPDIARGGMLLLIALANVHLYLYGHPLGIRAYPRDIEGLDQWVAMVQMTIVDGRAYPLFGFLFGYGIVQLARRRAAVGLPADAVTSLVRRRGTFMIPIGALHGVLLWSGDIVGAYGLIAVVLAGLLVHGSDRALLGTAAAGTLLSALFSAMSGLPSTDTTTVLLPSIAASNAALAAAYRLGEWLVVGLISQSLAVFAAVALGAWAARRGVLDDPAAHRTVLTRVAVAGIAAAALLGLPLALMAGQVWDTPPVALVMLAGFLHGISGYAGGLGYAALFGLLAIRLTRDPGPVTFALQACGQRSLSCYLAQSVAFAALLPAWTFGLGAQAYLWQAALYAIGAWLVILLVAAASARAGYRGPAETLLRRMTYGPRRVSQPSSS